MTTKAPKLLTVEEAAELMNVKPRFVRRLIVENRITFTKLGPTRQSPVRITEDDVLAYIQANRVEAGESV